MTNTHQTYIAHWDIHTLDTQVLETDKAQTTASVIHWRKPDGNFTDVKANNWWALKVESEVVDALGATINPATEEKQDALISTAQAIQELSEMNVLLKSILSAIILPRNADMSQNADRVSIAAWSVWITANQDLRNITSLQTYNGIFQTQQASFANEISWWYLAQRSTIN